MAPRDFTASFIDEVPSKYVDGIFNLLFDRLKQQVLARPRISSKERTFFEREAGNLQVQYNEILASENSQLKEAAVRAIASALCLSYYHSGGTQIIREFHLDQTAPARERKKRSGREFQLIVHREARKLWARSREFADNPRGTARNIYHAVAAEMDSLPNPPNWWTAVVATQTLGSGVVEKTKQSLRGDVSKEAKKRRIEAIRKCISRAQRQDQ